MALRRFFTDMGENITFENPGTGEKRSLGRYAYWINEFGKNEVVCVSDDLKTLKSLYGDLPVYRIKEK